MGDSLQAAFADAGCAACEAIRDGDAGIFTTAKSNMVKARMENEIRQILSLLKICLDNKTFTKYAVLV